MKFIYACCVICCLFACHRAKERSKEKERLDLYLSEVYHTNLHDYPRSIVILVSGGCGSCTKKTIRFIRKMARDERFNGYTKLLITPPNNAYVKDSIGESTGVRVIIDEHENLDKYGINLPKNLFMECAKGEVVFRDWLYLEKVDSIALKYGITL